LPWHCNSKPQLAQFSKLIVLLKLRSAIPDSHLPRDQPPEPHSQGIIGDKDNMTVKISLPSITSWKTSLAGVIALFVGAMQANNDGAIVMALKDPKVQLAMLIGIGLMLAKDSNVTGGTKGTPSTPEALAAANQARAYTAPK
jgi:hypothetical protein